MPGSPSGNGYNRILWSNKRAPIDRVVSKLSETYRAVVGKARESITSPRGTRDTTVDKLR